MNYLERRRKNKKIKLLGRKQKWVIEGGKKIVSYWGWKKKSELIEDKIKF